MVQPRNNNNYCTDTNEIPRFFPVKIFYRVFTSFTCQDIKVVVLKNNVT